MPRNHETGVDEYSRLKKLISVLGAAEGRFSTLFEDRNLNDDLGDIPGYEGLVKDLPQMAMRVRQLKRIMKDMKQHTVSTNQTAVDSKTTPAISACAAGSYASTSNPPDRLPLTEQTNFEKLSFKPSDDPFKSTTLKAGGTGSGNGKKSRRV